MFYRPDTESHGLPHNPFKALVAPRPIGWISTRDAKGRFNLAPYSFFNAVADRPPMVMFCSNGFKSSGPAAGAMKDSLSNVQATKVFAANIVSSALAEAMNVSAGNYVDGDDEFAIAGLTPVPCETIDCPRVAESPATLECRLHDVITLPGQGATENLMVLGLVSGVHIRDDVMKDGLVDVTRYAPLARLGYMDYASVTETFSMKRPS